MDECEQKSGTKRQLEHEDSAFKKIQRSESAQPVKIINLSNNCLEKIFMLLDLKYLLNVAIANKKLQPAAHAVFEHEFGVKKVLLHNVHNTPRANALIDGAESIIIYDFKTSLQFLRCFGAFITHLEFFYNRSSSKRYDHVNHYVNEYCARALVTIQFYDKPIFPIEQFVKPFVSVQNVMIRDCDLSEKFLPFASVFPAVCDLIIHGSVLNHRFIDVAPMCLERLTIALPYGKDYSATEQYSIINKLVQSNRQLRSLTILAYNSKTMALNTLLDMIKDNHLISELFSSAAFEPENVNAFEIERLTLEHPLLVALELHSYRFSSYNIMTIVRQLTALKKFVFCVHNSQEHENIESELDDGSWQSTHQYGFVTLNRVN